MLKKKLSIDKIRASRDGHEFHEAWTARKALQLLLPIDRFVGIAVEGLSPVDQSLAARESVEIADLTLFFGRRPAFSQSDKVIVVQFKYSIASATSPFRLSDAKETIRKFAASFRDHIRRYGVKAVDQKLYFELVTNRPISPALVEAIELIRKGAQRRGHAAKQAKQFISASGLRGNKLVAFANKIGILGLKGSLDETKLKLTKTVVDWSAAPDALSRARLGNLKQLVRDKAGSAGTGNNLITQTDVLAALELQESEDLLPCPDSFPPIGPVVKRRQLDDVATLVPSLSKPLLIHASGGVGKTVFMQSLARILAKHHQFVLFDCFGGGAYRAPEDARHLPKRGLIHIANMLACSGLCDPLLPTNENVEELIKAFRRRLSQVVDTLQRYSQGKKLLLFLDAIDNAAEHARDKGEPCFSKLLLESFHHKGPVSGVQIIVSCRSYRIAISKGDAVCEEILLEPFNESEAQEYLAKRVKGLTTIEFQVAYSRSGGNPRILEHLALSDRGLLDSSEITKPIRLDDLLNSRIEDALREALIRGYTRPQIESFLAGLSVLPPPVPVTDYADAHGIEQSAIQSFAADLAPLLDRTNQGMIFRDEPTETFIRQQYAAKPETLKLLASNLFRKQDASVYAARALPGLLQKLADGDSLFALAFDERFPQQITSTVAKREIRLARITAAVLYEAKQRDTKRLVQLLIELSMIAEVNQRGSDFVIENPDLVIASGEISAIRRLFEARTKWPGTRQSRLAIANLLSGDLNEAGRHAVRALDWIRHYYNQKDQQRQDTPGPERIDLTAFPLWLIADNRPGDAISFLKHWKDWYVYECCELLFKQLDQAEKAGVLLPEAKDNFLIKATSAVAPLCAALSFQELNPELIERFVNRLSKVCGSRTKLEFSTNDFQYSRHTRRYRLQDGLLKCAAIAIRVGKPKKAFPILQLLGEHRPNIWAFTDRFSSHNIEHFILSVALRAASRGELFDNRNILPAELARLELKGHEQAGLDLRAQLKSAIAEQYKAEYELPKDKKAITEHLKKNAEQFIDERMESIAEITQAFMEAISSESDQLEEKFSALLDSWTRLRKRRSAYGSSGEIDWFMDQLCRHMTFFVLWTRNDIQAPSGKWLLSRLEEFHVAIPAVFVELIELLAQKTHLAEVAGESAIKALRLIELENDVEMRTSLFAQLSRAILPASRVEAAGAFQKALEQLDTIGSGDYAFTNELLLFAASLKGGEIEERDFHALTNICELNIPEEAEKFPWGAFAQGLSRIAGPKVFAKLARWDDRSKISLDFTLMPYLTALLQDRKLEPEIALSLLRLCDPAETYGSGIAEFAKALEVNRYANMGELVSDLIRLFLQNKPGTLGHTVEDLNAIAERIQGVSPDVIGYISAAGPQFKKANDEWNQNTNWHGTKNAAPVHPESDVQKNDRQELNDIAGKTTITQESISHAVDSAATLATMHDRKLQLLEIIRKRVSFSERPAYIQSVAQLDNLEIYAKFQELELCKEIWGDSSISLGSQFSQLAVPLLQIHSEDFISYDRLSGYLLNRLGKLARVPITELARELIAIFCAWSSDISASVWMGLAGIMSDDLNEDEGQPALRRLLNSNAARLSSRVVDGEWADGLYPTGSSIEVAAGLVWFRLGSPLAANRWRAAHCVRALARFGRWDIIDAIFSKIETVHAGPFQASELQFYFLHARLWLLIAIARLAMDEPERIAKHESLLKHIALSEDTPHVLFRHFAASAILTCVRRRASTLSSGDLKKIRSIGVSPFPLAKRDKQHFYRHSFYQERDKGEPKHQPQFSLDYDFDKSDLSNVCELFDRPRWEVRDSLTKWVRLYDGKVSGMYETGGREGTRRNWERMGDEYHVYGQQLGWHALFLVAGEFLSKYPVVSDPYESDPWKEWKSRSTLTREDGLWLADGTDIPPVEAKVNLLERIPEGLAITGNQEKLLDLIGLRSPEFTELVVAGSWRSVDNIRVRVSSALAMPEEAERLARELAKEYPFHAYLPMLDDELEDTRFQKKKEGIEGWIVNPSTTARLDEYDPLAAKLASSRPRFSKQVIALGGLRSSDPFGRLWVGANNKVHARTEVWRMESYRSEGPTEGERLLCATDLLKTVMAKRNSDLLLLLILEKYESRPLNEETKFVHTLAVVHLKKSLQFDVYLGCVNHPAKI